MAYFFVGTTDSPVLVKYDDGVSYLPVFESETDAGLWAASLADKPSISPFSFSVARTVRDRAKATGHMVFIHPVHPTEIRK